MDRTEYARRYRKNHPEIIQRGSDRYYKKHRLRVLERQRKDRLRRPEVYKLARQRYYLEHRQEVLAAVKKWATENHEQYLKNLRRWHHKHKHTSVRKWRLANREKLNEFARNFGKTERGREVWRRSHAIRVRDLSFIPLFRNPFPTDVDVVWHHITNEFVVPFPKSVHLRCNTGEQIQHRKKVEIILKKWGFLQGFEILEVI